MGRPLFVYGSLMKDMWNNFLLENSIYLGKCVTHEKYLLVMEGKVPYLTVKERKYQVHGELYIVDDAVLAEVDQHEGNGAWYERRDIDIWHNGTMVQAQAYFNDAGEGVPSPYGEYIKYLLFIYGSEQVRH